MKHKILIVDDERDMCESIKNVLGEEFSCSFAYDGGSCLSSIEKEKPDLILLDIMMPGVDGFEICQRIKHDERFSNIPIIIITVLGKKEERIGGFKAGADDYITKPFDPDELIVRVNTHLRISKFAKKLHDEIERLKEHERLKIEFLSHIIHDLSIPLQDIEKEINLISSFQYGKLNEKQAEAIKEISFLCSKIGSMLSTFLDIARADSGKVWINIEEFELDKILSLVEARCRNEANNKGLSFELSYPKINIKTDKGRFIKLLDELLLNIIKFTEKGNISLIVKEDYSNNTIIFEVFTQSLIAEKLKMIFEDGIESSEDMGLVLVKRLVGLLRGNISILKDPSGVRFTIIFPKNIESPARRKEDKRN